MLIPRMKFTAVSLLFACLTSLVVCVLPRDPSDPSNAEVSPLIKNSQGVIVYHSAVDSMFRTVEIGVALHLPEYFDSVKIEISAEGEVTKTAILKDIDSLKMDDTIWHSIKFETPGVKNVLITPYSTVIQLKPVAALIVIAETPSVATGENHPPELAYSGTTILKPGDICQLTLTPTDQDSGQTVTVALAEMLTNTILNGNAFTWVPPASFIGTQTIKFTASDNGTPAKSTQLEVEIIITATPHPPTLSIDGRNNIKPGEICSLSIVTGDADAGQTVVVSMSGAPADAQLTNTTFIWKAPDVASVEYEITFTATDNGNPPLSTNSVIKVAVVSSGSVNSAPKWEIATLERAISDTGKLTLSLSGICKDPEDDLLTFALLDGIPEGDVVVNDEYRFTATPAVVGTHYAKITATDPEGLSDTLEIKITVENIDNDSTPPVITLITPSETSAISNSASFTIDALCSDPSGISSAIALFDGKEFLAAVADNHYKMTVTGLKPGENEITILVKDATPAKNEATKVISIKFVKPEISALELVTPAAGATGVDTLPAFSWNGGDGSTGTDTVKYQVRYGTSADNLTTKSGSLTVKSLMLTSATKLMPFTKYYWQVVAWSVSVADTVRSPVQAFTTFDPTAADNAGPTITQLSGVKNGERVKIATGSLSFSITDNSGIDSIYWTLNGAPGAVPAKQGDGSYIINYSQIPFGANKVTIGARDKSTAKNSASVEIVFTYNTEITPVTLSAPATLATAIAATPVFTWTGGDDADGDSVFYIVKYGAAANALTTALPAVTAKTASVPPANPLAANTGYFWMVIAYSKVNSDTVKSPVWSFTTIGTTPAIISVTIPASVNFGEKLTLSVTASGNPQPTVYTWYCNNTPIPGATTATYEKASAGGTDTGTYFVKVSNGVSEVSSTPARLDVKCKVSFNSNSGSHVDSQYVSFGKMATAPSAAPTRTGFKFLGWFTSESAAAEFSFGTTAITGNITLIAKWVAVYTLDISASTGGGGVVKAPSQTDYVEGTQVTVTATAQSGYRFDGWGGDTSGNTNPLTVMVKKNRTITAKFKRQFTLTLATSDANKGTVSSSNGNSPLTVDSGSTVNISATAKSGFKFKSWSVSAGQAAITGSSLAITTVDMSQGNATVTASWDIATYTITYFANGNSSGSAPSDPNSYASGSAILILANTGKLLKGSASFVGWNTSSNATGQTFACGEATTMPSQDLKLYAMYSINSVMDNDGNIYKTVQIGNQIWIEENLKTTKFNDGSSIPYVEGNDDWSILTTPGYCWYGNDNLNKEVYGGLYNWYAVNSHKLAPAGWHIPSDLEWSTLIVACGDSAAEKMRADSSLWYPGYPNLNTIGFAALPGGWRDPDGLSQIATSMGMWWTSDESDDLNAMTRLIWYYMPEVYSPTYGKSAGISVRCIRDN